MAPLPERVVTCETCGRGVELGPGILSRIVDCGLEPLSHGWHAECKSCPGTVEPQYGALVYPGTEFDGTQEGRHAAERWCIAHREEFPGHNPTALEFWRTTMTVTGKIDTTVWRALFGDAPMPRIGEQ